MRLRVGMVAYNDGPIVVTEDGEEIEIDISYDTVDTIESQPALTLQLKNIPTGELTGTLVGDYQMSGDLDGSVTLNLMFSGRLQDDGTGKVIRVPGSTTVTGSATSGDGVYEVALTI
jgi:hypothetical protein